VRVVSLVPSVTETLLAWNITPIAVTRFCEHPELPHVGGTKDPDVAAIIEMRPDLVVLCDEENRRDDAAALEEAGIAIHVMTVESVDAVAPQLDALAAAVGLEAVEAATTSTTPALPPRRRAFVPVWRRPWMTMNASTYGSSMLASIGIDNVFADADTRYPETTLDEARAARPDIVIAPSEPYPFKERHRDELESVATVVFVDGQDLFWWGVRTAAARRRLSERLDRRTR
jgi:ABC-type Fe3+-hydroxamate transport system substrate-binding protein